MEENQKQAIQWIKDQRIKGALTGSCLLGYFEGSDVDFFAYSEASFTQMFYAMYHNPMFQILDPLEVWKANKFIERKLDNYNKTKLVTIKFMYNTCLPVNIIFKSHCTDGYSVISTFDMDVIAKCYDTFIQQEIDLTYGSTVSKVVSWNKHNQNFYDPELWQISRILRQLERVIKYHKRGYNTDAVVYKYIDLIDEVQKFQDIFSSNNFSETLKIRKSNSKIVKKICEKWLETHEISDEQLELLKEKIKEV
jgi:hypothetical protein